VFEKAKLISASACVYVAALLSRLFEHLSNQSQITLLPEAVNRDIGKIFPRNLPGKREARSEW
jgi:hypothetical protein